MKKKILMISAAVLAVLLTVLLVMVYAVVPKVVEKRKLAEEERIAEEIRLAEETAEAARQELLSVDEVDLQSLEYNGVFLSMTGSNGWSMDVQKGFIGIDVVKNNAMIENTEELMRLWNAAMSSENDIGYAYLILDPAKLYYMPDEPETVTEEGSADETAEKTAAEAPTAEPKLEVDLDEIVGKHPDIEFRIFTSVYHDDYWQQLTDEEFELVLSQYKEVMSRLLEYENVTLACYTGEDWLVDNPDLYLDTFTGDLVSEITTKLFLYTYLDSWPVTEDNLPYCLSRIEKNCRPDPKEEPLPEPKVSKWKIFKEFVFGEKEEEPPVEEPDYSPDLSGYDIIFFGDSIFALSDGPYSAATVVENVTGAKTYNISKGGLTSEVMAKVVSNLVTGAPTGEEGWDVFDREVTRYAADDHTDRKTVILLNVCINDYIGGYSLKEFEKNYKETLIRLKDAYPEAELVFVAPLYIQYASNGTLPNEIGLTMNEYRALAVRVAAECGADTLDLLATGKFNDYNSARYLEDGTHPTPAGCKVIAGILCEYLDNVLE